MKFGLNLGTLNPNQWLAATLEADRGGFESAWMPEHLILPVALSGSPFDGAEHPPIPADVPVFDPFAYLAYLAAVTSTIRLGTFVYNIGLRHPFVTARGAATVDVLSAGRLNLGIGASWLRAEWDATGLDFDSRGARIDEIIDICHRLWSEPVVEHHGRFFDFGPVMFEPKPVQLGGPALHVGGDGPAALRRAARIGTGWVPMNHHPERLPASMARLAALADEAGRTTPVEVTLAVDIRSPADVEPYERAGVDRIIVRPWRRSAEAVDAIIRFCTEVIG